MSKLAKTTRDFQHWREFIRIPNWELLKTSIQCEHVPNRNVPLTGLVQLLQELEGCFDDLVGILAVLESQGRKLGDAYSASTSTKGVQQEDHIYQFGGLKMANLILRYCQLRPARKILRQKMVEIWELIKHADPNKESFVDLAQHNLLCASSLWCRVYDIEYGVACYPNIEPAIDKQMHERAEAIRKDRWAKLSWGLDPMSGGR